MSIRNSQPVYKLPILTALFVDESSIITSVELQNVTKRYGEQIVIPSLDLRLESNITTAIVGESGSGKSTLLQLINGLVRPDEGQIALNHKPIDYNELPSTRRAMGYAVQGAGLFPHLTVEENVALIARLENWSEDAISQRISHLFTLLDLGQEFTQRFPNSLSGGQQQRVSLCRAMMLNPALLLLDEPFSALDPITRHSIHQEFIDLQQAESRTIVLVTHDMSEAMKLSQQVVILKSGEVVQHGTVDEVRRTPANEYVRRLLDISEAR